MPYALCALSIAHSLFPMNLKILNPIEVPDWNDQISKFQDATIFHTSNWAQVLSESYGYKPLYFCTFENNSLTGFIPVMEINSFLTGRRGVSLPFSDQSEPLVKDKKHFNIIFDQIVLFGREKKWKTFCIHGGGTFLDTSKPFETYVSSFLELDQNPDQLKKQFKSSTRRNIKKALKSGVTTEISASFKSISEFYRLNCLSRKDHGLPPQPFVFFKNIYEKVLQKKMGFVCLGYLGKKIVAGVIFLLFNDRAVYKYGASEKKFLPYRPNNLVFSEALKRCSAIGSRFVDFGRTELHHEGLLQFKRSWGCAQTPLSYYKIDPSSEHFVNSEPGIKSSYEIFRFLPVPALKFLGNILYKHVG